MCFGETLTVGLSSLLATHPPIEERIKAIDPTLLPRLKARFRQRMATTQTTPETAPQPTYDSPQTTDADALSTVAAGFATGAASPSPAMHPTRADAAGIKASVGQPTPAHGDFAHQLHASIPAPLRQAAHDPNRAAALVFALLLTEMRSHGQQSLQLITERMGGDCARDMPMLYGPAKQADPALRLPLLDIALTTLKALDAAGQDKIVTTSRELIDIDGKVTLSEFIYGFLIRQALNPPKKPLRSIKSFATIEPDLALLFSAIVQSSGEAKEQQAENFRNIMASYSRGDFSATLDAMPTPTQLTRALDRLNRLSPLLKQPVIDACVDCVLHDAKVTMREMELLRAVSEALECPMPPLQVTLQN